MRTQEGNRKELLLTVQGIKLFKLTYDREPLFVEQFNEHVFLVSDTSQKINEYRKLYPNHIIPESYWIDSEYILDLDELEYIQEDVLQELYGSTNTYSEWLVKTQQQAKLKLDTNINKNSKHEIQWEKPLENGQTNTTSPKTKSEVLSGSGELKKNNVVVNN